MKNKNYIISYVTNSGLTVLNHLVENCKDIVEAIEEIKGDVGVYVILSCIPKR